MKYLFALLIYISLYSPSYAQDSLKYRYAILFFDLSDNDVSIEYSNGDTEELYEKLQLNKLGSRNQMLFRSFNYLNDKGYEFLSSQLIPERIWLSSNAYNYRREYIFSRKRSISK